MAAYIRHRDGKLDKSHRRQARDASETRPPLKRCHACADISYDHDAKWCAQPMRRVQAAGAGAPRGVMATEAGADHQ